MRDRAQLLVRACRLHLHGPIDPIAVDHLRRQIDRLEPGRRTILIDCTKVTEIDPIGMAALWSLCARSERTDALLGLTRLPERLLRRLRSHPILAYIMNEDELFRDPFGSLVESER